MSEATPTTQRRDTVLVLLVIGALVLYAPGMLWGLPYATAADRVNPWGSDELAPLGPLAQVFHVVLHGGSAFDPRYPLLPYALQTLFMAPYLLWLRLSGGQHGFAMEYPFGLSDPVGSIAGLTLAARVSSLVMMAAVPATAYWTAKRVWGKRTGVFAGVCALLVYPFFYYARTSNVDAGGLLWTVLGVAAFAAILQDGLTIRRGVWLGIFAALSAATKDQNYAIFMALGLAAVALHLRDARRRGESLLVPPLAALGAAVFAYLLATGIVFRPSSFATHVNFILFHPGGTNGQSYYSAPATLGGYTQLLREYGAQIVSSVGVPMAIAGTIGVVVAAVRRPRTLLLALPVLALFLGVIAPVRFTRIRFVLPAAYLCALFAGVAMGALAGEGEKASGPAGARMPLPVRRIAARVAFALIAGWALLRGADLTYQNVQRFARCRGGLAATQRTAG